MSSGRSGSARPDAGATTYKQLKLAIIEYRFRPNERLLVPAMAERLGVSLTPVREALVRLYAEGLLEFQPKRGFLMKKLNVRDMIDHYRFGYIVLKHAIRANVSAFDMDEKSVPSISADHLGIQRSEKDQESTQNSFVCFLERLYLHIASLSENNAMVGFIRGGIDRTHYVRIIDLQSPDRVERVHDAVVALIRRLGQGDRKGAIEILEAELEQKLRIMPNLVERGLARPYLES